jgi:hypothetical protein
MTLKEKFRPLVWFNSGSFNISQEREKDENSIKCEKIAEQFAIEFLDSIRWCLISLLNGEEPKAETAEELLEIFKKEK